MKKGSKKVVATADCIKCGEKVPLIKAESHVCDVSFKITLKLGGKVLTGEGKTMFEALNKLPVPNKIVSKGVLSVGKDKPYEMVLMPSQLKRLFYPLALPYTAKKLTFLVRK